MTELRAEFTSCAQWEQWAREHDGAGLRRAVLDAVRANGLVEPFTGQARRAADVAIDETALRESLVARQLNARDRALLLELERLRQAHPELQRPRARIWAPGALSRLATLFRGRYPQFLASEHLPGEKQRREHFPIPHVDLQAIDLPQQFFDLVFSADHLARQADAARMLAGVARVLRPGGHFVATVPFDPLRADSQAGAGPAGPGQKSGPAGVFGWDLLPLAQAAGLVDAQLVLHVSARHGVTGDAAPGVFVLVARRPAAAEAPRAEGLPAGLERLVAILGIPRSGTTMLTAAFASAPGVCPVYEPFNADKAALWREGEMSLPRMLRDYRVALAGCPTLLVKETSAKHEYVGLMRRVLADAGPPMQRCLLVILRNPLHCFLSEVQGRREWWGEPDLQVSAELFDQWAQRTLRSLRAILDLQLEFGGYCVSYSALARAPGRIVEAFAAAGLAATGAEARFHETLDASKVRGDISLATNPRPIGAESEDRRADEVQALAERVRTARSWPAMGRLVDAIDSLADPAVRPASDPRVAALHALLATLKAG